MSFPVSSCSFSSTTELKSDGAAVLRRVFEFLGVAPDFVPDNLGVNYRPGSSSRRLRLAADLNVAQRARRGKLTRAPALAFDSVPGTPMDR